MIGSQRIGIIGAGGVVSAFHLPVLRAISGAHVQWICDADLQRARKVAAAFGIPRASSSLEQCAEVDIVLLAIPVGARKGVLDVVLSRGWHALCEKPFAVSSRDHLWMISKARAQRVRLAAALVRRTYGSVSLVRDVLRSGLLGRITSVAAGEGARTQRTGRDSHWYQSDARAVGGGTLMETGVHLVDQMLTLCDASEVLVTRSDQVIVGDLEFDTNASGTLTTENSGPVPFEIRVSSLEDVYNGVIIRCERGQVTVGLGVADPIRVVVSGRSELLEMCPSRGPQDLLQAFHAEWTAFATKCLTGPDFDDRDTGLLTTTLIEACYRLGGRSAAPVVSTHTE